LQGVDLDIREGEIVSMIGRNGAGKSTALKTIVGLIAKRTGSVMFRGEEILSKAPHIRLHRGLGYVPEDPARRRRLTVRENLRLGLIAAPNRSREAEAIHHGSIVIVYSAGAGSLLADKGIVDRYCSV
jgi:branched-chain amino acid transport system ATP-binding protein